MPLVLPAVVLLLGLLPATRARTQWWRWIALGVAVLLLSACVLAPQGADRAAWPGALSLGATTGVVPLLLAAADPVRHWRRAFGRPRLRSAGARVLMFPLVAGVLSAVVLTAVYTTGLVDAAVGSGGAWLAAQAAALGVGCLVALPLLTDELLPAWCTPAVKAGLAALDGVVDAIPGIVVMTTRDWVTGQTLLAVAEAVAVPIMLWVAAAWARHDTAQARRIDAELDEQPHDERPWWERDAPSVR